MACEGGCPPPAKLSTMPIQQQQQQEQQQEPGAAAEAAALPACASPASPPGSVLGGSPRSFGAAAPAPAGPPAADLEDPPAALQQSVPAGPAAAAVAGGSPTAAATAPGGPARFAPPPASAGQQPLVLSPLGPPKAALQLPDGLELPAQLRAAVVASYRQATGAGPGPGPGPAMQLSLLGGPPAPSPVAIGAGTPPELSQELAAQQSGEFEGSAGGASGSLRSASKQSLSLSQSMSESDRLNSAGGPPSPSHGNTALYLGGWAGGRAHATNPLAPPPPPSCLLAMLPHAPRILIWPFMQSRLVHIGRAPTSSMRHLRMRMRSAFAPGSSGRVLRARSFAPWRFCCRQPAPVCDRGDAAGGVCRLRGHR